MGRSFFLMGLSALQAIVDNFCHQFSVIFCHCRQGALKFCNQYVNIFCHCPQGPSNFVTKLVTFSATAHRGPQILSPIGYIFVNCSHIGSNFILQNLPTPSSTTIRTVLKNWRLKLWLQVVAFPKSLP